jgi:hypothetical protein
MGPFTLPNKALKRKPVQSRPQPISGLLELPWDVQRLIFEDVPSDIWRSVPVGHNDFYYISKSIEVDLLQVSGQVNATASYSMQHNQTDQPCVLAFSPFKYEGVETAIVETIELAHIYDMIYTNRVPKNQKPVLSISPLAASLTFQTLKNHVKNAGRHHFLRTMDLSQKEFNAFITQMLLQLRRKLEIELRLHVPERSFSQLMNDSLDIATPRLLWYLELTRRLLPRAKGDLRWHLTIVSGSRDVQDKLQATWDEVDIREVNWEVVKDQDLQAWQALDKLVSSRS